MEYAKVQHTGAFNNDQLLLFITMYNTANNIFSPNKSIQNKQSLLTGRSTDSRGVCTQNICSVHLGFW